MREIIFVLWVVNEVVTQMVTEVVTRWRLGGDHFGARCHSWFAVDPRN